MGDSQGFDDQFNDGLFRASLHTSKLTRPRMWPKSVSEMRNYTSYGSEGMANDYDTGHSSFMMRRPYAPRGAWLFNFGRGSWEWADRR
jgi:hypothetical protein